MVDDRELLGKTGCSWVVASQNSGNTVVCRRQENVSSTSAGFKDLQLLFILGNVVTAKFQVNYTWREFLFIEETLCGYE